MHTITSISHSELQDGFWSEFSRALTDLTSRDQEDIFIWLSGGSSLDIFYVTIKERFRELPLDVRRRVRFCFLDERVVPVDHPDSNEGQLRKKFLDQLVPEWIFSGEQIIGISSICHFERSDSEVEKSLEHRSLHSARSSLQSRWQEEILAHQYSLLVSHIDIWFFWVGPDGHIASLFPAHPLLDSSEDGFLEILDSPKPPPHRITVSPRMIEKIPYTFVAFMRWKEEAYGRFLDERISVKDCPAKMLQKNQNLVVMSEFDR